MLTSQNPPDLDKHALELFAVDNPDLERLEVVLKEFNAFEAMGVVRQEERHSDFLAFLLNPKESHGFGDAVARRLLKMRVKQASVEPSLTTLELELSDLSDGLVLREWQDIDILLLFRNAKLAVIIENKIDTLEHSDQLRRYYDVVKRHYEDYAIIGFYLTPSGATPSHDFFSPLTYGSIAEIVDEEISRHRETIASDVLALTKHYTKTLRRHLVEDSELKIICQRLYERHQRALDLIFEYRPDYLGSIAEQLQDLISTAPELVKDYSSKSYVRFCPKEWDAFLSIGQGWTRSGRLLLFEFNIFNDLRLKLVLGPGPQEAREILFRVAQENKDIFKPASLNLPQKWAVIYTRVFIPRDRFENREDDQRKEEISKQWDSFTMGDLPKIRAIINPKLPEVAALERPAG